jgi:DNA-binding Lrp family transcriptional regulator
MRSESALDSSTVDAIDQGVVHCLQLNPRAQFRLIADVLGVSEQTVARRYRRMRSEGLVRVVSIVTPTSFGQSSWLVRIQTRPDTARPLSLALAQRSDVTWVTIGAGGTDVAAQLQSRSAADRDDLLLERLPRQTKVLGYTVQSVMHRYFRANGAEWTVQSPLVSADAEQSILARLPATGPDPSVRLMPDDEPMVAALAADGRTSIAELAQQTHWSEARVNRRLAALLASGVIFLDVDLAYPAFGIDNAVEMWLTVEPAHLHAVGQSLAQLSEIAFCVALTGTANLMAGGWFRAEDELYGFVTERISTLPGIRQAELSAGRRCVKLAGSIVEGGRLTGPRTVPHRL